MTPPAISASRDLFSECLISSIRELPGYATESTLGPLVDIQTLDPLIDCATKASHQQQAGALKDFSTCIIDYLQYIQTVESLQDKKLILQLNPGEQGLSCMPVKLRKGLPNPLAKKDRIFLKDVHGQKYINDKRTISLEAFYELKQQAQQCVARYGTMSSNAQLAQNQRATGNAIAGHGALDKDYKSFTLPHNISLRTHCLQGQAMPDRLGIHIEAGKYDALAGQTFERTYNPGNFVPDYRIYPPDDKINTLSGSITVPHPTYLSKIIEVLSSIADKYREQMTIDLATCQSYILPDPAKQPKENISVRLDLFERDKASLTNDYGTALPEPAKQHLRQTLNQIIADATQLKLYSPTAKPSRLNRLRRLTNRINQARENLYAPPRPEHEPDIQAQAQDSHLSLSNQSSPSEQITLT